jgi:adhesin transport system outer membrane protein
MIVKSCERRGRLFRASALFLTAAAPVCAAQPVQTLLVHMPIGLDIDNMPDRFLRAVDQAPPDGAFARAIAEATRRAPTVNEAIASVRETQGVRAEVRAGLRPRVEIEVTGQKAIDRRFSNDRNNILERSRPDLRDDASLTAEQLLFDFGATSRRIGAARAREDAARAGVTSAAETAALEAASAWYEIYLADAEVDLADALVVRHQSVLADTRARVTAGLGARADLARVETYIAAAQARTERAHAAREAARLKYRSVADTEPPLYPARPTVPPDASGGYASALAAAQRSPAMMVATDRAEAARRDLAAVRADRWPRFSGGIDAAKYSVSSDVIDHDVRARLTMRYQLTGGGITAARESEAAARVAQQDFVAERVRNETARDAGIAYRAVESLAREAAILRDAYLAARRTRDAYNEQFRVARGSLLELLRAQVDLHDAAVAYARAIAERDLARYTLLARTGELLAFLRIDIDIDAAPRSTRP